MRRISKFIFFGVSWGIIKSIIIRKFAFLFGVSIIKGLIFDKPDKNLDKSLDELCKSCECTNAKDKQ